MKCKKLAVALAFATALPIAAHAVPQIQTPDGLLTPFGGFDWTSAAPAYVTGATFDPNAPAGTVSNQFNLYYFSTAAAVQRTSGPNFFTPNLAPDGTNNGSTYEITHVTNLTETATCSVAADASGICNGVLTFQLVSGAWSVWLHDDPNANFTNGTGFTDGDQILAGTWTSTSGEFNAATGSGNQLDLLGTVTFTNSTYINPDMEGTNASSTLQLFGGSQPTTIVNPGQFPVLGGGFVDVELGVPGNALFQADANQGLAVAVPVPGSLALLASALIGMGFVVRRSTKN